MKIGGLEVVSNLSFGPEFVFPFIASAISLFLLIMFLFYFKFSNSSDQKSRIDVKLLIVLSFLVFIYNVLETFMIYILVNDLSPFIIASIKYIFIGAVFLVLWVYLDLHSRNETKINTVFKLIITTVVTGSSIVLLKTEWIQPYIVFVVLLIPILISTIKLFTIHTTMPSYEQSRYPLVYIAIFVMFSGYSWQVTRNFIQELWYVDWIFSCATAVLLMLLGLALIIRGMNFNREVDRNRNVYSNLLHSIRRMIDQLINTSQEMVDNYQSLINNSEKSEKSVGDMADSFSKLIEVAVKARENSNSATMMVEENVEVFQSISSIMIEQKESIVAIDDYLKNLKLIVDNINHNSNNMAEAINNLTDKVENGKKLVSKNLSSMNTIKEFIEQVYYIVDVIYDISDQINILAMNASIEAAHAGDRGKGFAVVADEIRNVSVLTSEEANTIGDNISQIIEKIDNGSSVVNQTSEIFNSFSTNIEKLFVYILKVIDTSKELLSEIENISEDMKQLKNSAIASSRKSDSESRINNELLTKMKIVKRYIDKTSSSVEKENDRVQTILGDVSNLIDFSKNSQKIVEELNQLRDDLQKYVASS